jgi:hypothetical protein
MKCKTVYVLNEKIFLVGGLQEKKENMEGEAFYYREDYIFEKNKNKFRLKIRKV